jgi:hypothetical protein
VFQTKLFFKNSTLLNETLLCVASLNCLLIRFTIHEADRVDGYVCVLLRFQVRGQCLHRNEIHGICVWSYIRGYCTVPACIFNSLYRATRTSTFRVDSLPVPGLNYKLLLIVY